MWKLQMFHVEAASVSCYELCQCYNRGSKHTEGVNSPNMVWSLPLPNQRPDMVMWVSITETVLLLSLYFLHADFCNRNLDAGAQALPAFDGIAKDFCVIPVWISIWVKIWVWRLGCF
jgi:hypothetical protein